MPAAKMKGMVACEYAICIALLALSSYVVEFLYEAGLLYSVGVPSQFIEVFVMDMCKAGAILYLCVYLSAALLMQTEDFLLHPILFWTKSKRRLAGIGFLFLSVMFIYLVMGISKGEQVRAMLESLS